MIQHSAPAGNDRNVNPVTGTNTVSKRDFAFMIPPPFVFDYYSRPFSKRVREAKTASALQWYLPLWRLVTDKFRAVGSGDRLALLETPAIAWD